jgi:hypothetical protein
MGKVRERSQHDVFPVRIGRSYENNDIVIDDDYVSPHHLSVAQDEDGRVVITDLHSDNGTSMLPSRERLSQAVIETEGVLRVGHTIVRVRTPAFELPPTRREGQHFTRITNSFNRPTMFAAIVLLTAASLCFDAYWNDFARPDWGELVMVPLWTMVGLGVWAGFWAMASRISQQTFSFRIHWCIACLALVVASLFEVMREYYMFAFAAGWSGLALLWGMAVVWLGALLWGHLRLCTLMSSRKLALNAGAAAGCVVGLFAISWYTSTSEFNTFTSFHPALKPPAFQITGKVSADEFFTRVGTLQEKVDAQLEKD